VGVAVVANYMGIDPGKSGFITIISGEEYFFSPIPLIGKYLDVHELNEILAQISKLPNLHCVMEDVHAKFGSSAKATFSFGFICGVTEALIMSNKIPLTKIQPKEWQKEIWKGIPIQKKASSTGKTMVNDTKLMSLMAAKRLFPDVDLKANNRCKIPHDGKVDSLLIAEFCRRKYGKI